MQKEELRKLAGNLSLKSKEEDEHDGDMNFTGDDAYYDNKEYKGSDEEIDHLLYDP